MLFKAEERGTGEDWAEKITCELSRRIELPHVDYELAEEYDGDKYLQPGVVCASCAAEDQDLVLGNQMLFFNDQDYPVAGPPRYKIREYTVAAVVNCVDLLDLPFGPLPHGIETAMDVFVGYIALDAWVANQDRHHENWGALYSMVKEDFHLAPTFDHGASLARNLPDEERKDRLESKDEKRQVAHFAKRAISAFYGTPQDKKTLGTVEAFEMFAKAAPAAAQAWLNAIGRVTKAEMEAIIQEVPPGRMSPVARNFTLELMAINQQRLLDIKI